MNIVPILYLAGVLAGPLHAQVCSGGNDGGTDATGNQCSTPTDVAAYKAGSGITRSAQAAKLGGVQPSVAAARTLIGSEKMSGPPSTQTVVAEPASRMAKAAALPSVPVETAKIEIGSASPCSGGADGGMDVTGNQCGEAPAATGILLVAHHSKR
ncbi:MAG: hypothetical protein OEX23_08045 [Betaproteobacteria bacterium]|jgi:hypothetical protein|nr:hypothetical protein [Betaproteobacteria bacterium]